MQRLRNNNKVTLVVYTLSHFIVDFCCFCMLFGVFLPAAPSLLAASEGFLLYNVLAFGLQPLVGSVCDANRRVPIAAIGVSLLLAGLLLGGAAPYAALIACALGNACFHVGGGIDSLANANGKAARSGVFVSSGALGVSFGTLFGNLGARFSLALPIALAATALLLLVLFVPTSKHSEPYRVNFDFARAARSAGAVVALCAVSIAVRSFAGFIVPMSWKATAWLAVLPGAASALGKASGGVLADKFGARRVGVVSLLLSVPLLVFGQNAALVSLLGLALFNMTMPITLCAVASKLPHNPGLAFGITTLALLVGTVPVFFVAVGASLAKWLIAVLVALSAACLFAAAPARSSRQFEMDIKKEKSR